GGAADELTDGSAQQTLEALAQARAQYQRGTATLGAYPWKQWRSLVAVAGLLAVPLLVFALDKVGAIPATAQLFAGVSAALALVAGGLRSVSSYAKTQLDRLDKAETAVRVEIEQKRRKLDDQVRAAEAKVADKTAEVEALAARDAQLGQELAALEVRARAV